jgi:hypothetical protein
MAQAKCDVPRLHDPDPLSRACRGCLPDRHRRAAGRARSYALLASFSLAKPYQSTGLANDAHAVLAPALESFSPTPEMPEITEAMSLSTRLAQVRFGQSSAFSEGPAGRKSPPN